MLLIHIYLLQEKQKKMFTNADIWIYSECGWICNEIRDFEQGLKYLLEAENQVEMMNGLTLKLDNVQENLKEQKKGLKDLKNH